MAITWRKLAYHSGIRNTKDYTGIHDCVETGVGQIQAEPSITESLDIVDDATQIVVESGTTIYMPTDFKINRSKTNGTALTGRHIFKIDGKTDVTIDGGELDGNAASNGYYGEWDMGIYIIDSQRIRIKNMYLHHHSGDGIYIRDSEDVNIENCSIYSDNVTEKVTNSLDGAINDAVTTITLADASSFPASGYISIETEEISYSGKAGNDLTGCTRGFGTTSAAAHADTITVRSVLVGRCSIAIVSFTTNCKNIRVINCTLHSGNPAAIDIETENDNTYIEDVIIDGNRFLGDSDTFRGVAIENQTARSIRRIVVSNNVIKDMNYGVTVYGEGTFEDILIDGNIIESCNYGIFGYHSNNVMISNNRINNAVNQGILFTNLLRSITIQGNVVWGSGSYGIRLDGASGSENIDIQILNNVVYDNTGHGIFLDYTDDVAIIGNVCFDNASTQTYPINLDNCDSVFVNANLFYDHTSGDTVQNSGCNDLIIGINKEGSSLYLRNNIVCTGEIEIDGDLNHDGSNVGFYGTAPIAQAVLATGGGATVDNVITALQNLGLVKQS